jgi:YD repeat-containing protein
MNRLIRSIGFAAGMLLLFPVATPVQAIDRSQCKQYGGTADCWGPVIGRWKYDICEEGPASNAMAPAKCQAQGGTWNGINCIGLPPLELWRPTFDGDIVPLAQDEFRNFHAPLCEGPNSTPYTWGVNIFSNFCSTAGPGPIYVLGYEQHNNTNHFVISGKKVVSGQCSSTNTTLTYSASRDRLVECPSHGDQSYYQTSGATPALCSLGWMNPITPRQCNDCNDKSPNPRVGNPIDPITGVKRQVEVDYAGNGPQPLRFERVYHNRVYVLDGKHWRHNYSARVEFQSFGTVPVASAHRAGGRSFPYRQIGGVFVPDVDIIDKLTKLVDGGGALIGWEFLEASSHTLETYDSAGRLLAITSRAGLTQTLDYSTAATPISVAPEPGLLIRVMDHFGRQLNFTYDAIARMVTMQDPAGQTYQYAYNANGVITSVTYPDTRKRTYIYGENNLPWDLLTGIVDENNSRFARYFYGIYGNLRMAVGSQHAGNLGAGIDYASWPNSILVRDALGTARTYTYQLLNGVYLNTGITQPAASGAGTATSATTYGANNNVSMRRDFNGNRTNYNTYELARNLETSRTEGLTAAGAATPATRIIETQWHATFRLPTLITEKTSAGTVLRTTGMSYDTNGNLLARTVTDVPASQSRTWTYTYNANGSVLTMDGPRTDLSDVTTYTYYDNTVTCPGASATGCRGQVETITNAAGHVTTITEYNAHGQPLTILDPNALSTTLAYDLRQRLTSRSVGAETTGYEYDGVGQLKKVTLPDGSFLSYTYDAAHLLTQIADNLGNRIAYTLDAMGNRTKEEVFDTTSTLQRTLARAYEALNRLRLEIHP